ncbi:MAG: hypothetical protein ACOYL3_17030 [Desulfuromonadaceae bacterium]
MNSFIAASCGAGCGVEGDEETFRWEYRGCHVHTLPLARDHAETAYFMERGSMSCPAGLSGYFEGA